MLHMQGGAEAPASASAASSSQEAPPDAPASARDSRNPREDFRKAITDVKTAVVVTREMVNVASIKRPMLRFLVVRQLGAGSHSTVHLVQRKQDARLLVMKRWIKSPPDALREAKMLKGLHHPNIVRVHEYFTDPATRQLCIVMDYATQGDLQCRIDTAKGAGETIDDEYALRILVQLCLAAAHIHSRGILHRDIKPANVFIAETPHRESGGGGDVLAYLGDFSVSTQLSGAADLASTITGTPYYLAPEVVRGEPYGVKSDIWSIGVVLYVMLTLQLPFRATSLPALARLITDTEAPLPRERDAQLVQSVRMCLAKRAETRPSAQTVLRLPAMQMMRRRYTSRKLRQASAAKLSPVWQMSPEAERHLSEREHRCCSDEASTGGSPRYYDEAIDEASGGMSPHSLVVAELEDCMHEFGRSEHLPRARRASGDAAAASGHDGPSGLDDGPSGSLHERSTSPSESTRVRRVPFGRRASHVAETLVERKLRTTSVYTDATPPASPGVGSPGRRPEGERFTDRTSAGSSHASFTEASSERQQSPQPTFDLALLYFSCGNRSRAGNLYVTATHLAFIPLISGRRISIHLERVQCLLKSRPWALLPGEGRSLQVVLQPPLGLEPSLPGDAPQGRKQAHRANRNISFHGFWSREAVVSAILQATAARGMKMSVYKQRRLTLSVVHRKQPALSLVEHGSKRGSTSLAGAPTAVATTIATLLKGAADSVRSSTRRGSGTCRGSGEASSIRGGSGSSIRRASDEARSSTGTPAISTRHSHELPGVTGASEEKL